MPMATCLDHPHMYNPRRRHSALSYESPLRYERIHAAEALRALASEKARAVQPPGATLTEGGAISVSPNWPYHRDRGGDHALHGGSHQPW